MLKIKVNTQYKYSNSGYTWGIVKDFSVKTGECTVVLYPDFTERTFGLYEVNNWIKDGILVEC